MIFNVFFFFYCIIYSILRIRFSLSLESFFFFFFPPLEEQYIFLPTIPLHYELIKKDLLLMRMTYNLYGIFFTVDSTTLFKTIEKK